MRFGVMCAFLLSMVLPISSFAQGYNSKVGRGGVAITPRGFSANSVSRLYTADSFSVKNETRAISLDKAVAILADTNIITSPKIGVNGSISAQALAFASILHYHNKSTARATAKRLFDFSNTIEAKVYAVMTIYSLWGKSEYDLVVEKIDLDKEVNTLFSEKFRSVKLSEFFTAFLKDPSQFIPKSDILKVENSAQVVAPTSVIICVPKRPIRVIKSKN